MATLRNYITRADESDDTVRKDLWKKCTPGHMQGWQLQANEVADRVYVSDVYTATSERALKDLGITHVISLVEANTRLPVDVGAHLQIYIADNSKCDILEHFEDTTDFIRDALAINPSNRVLVHCVWGMSRSVSVAVAYLVATRDMFYHEAFEVVQNRRPLARPNDGFAKQIVRYAVEVGVPRRRSLKAVRAAREKAATVQERTPVNFGPQTNFPEALTAIAKDDDLLVTRVQNAAANAATSLVKGVNMMKLVDSVS